MQILLISNSTLYQRGYLDHVAASLQKLFGAARRIVFVPYALFDREAYARKAEQRFHDLGLELVSVHRTGDPRAAVAAADGIFIGLREGSFIECDDRAAVLAGPFSARVFRRGHEPLEVPPQTDLRQFA